MLRWGVNYYTEKKGYGEFKVYGCLADAIAQADYEWSHMTENERKDVNYFYVGLFNVDDRGDWAEKDNGEIDCDPRTVAKDWKLEIPSWIDSCIIQLGLTMADIAKKFGIPYRTVQNWKSGEREAPLYVQDLIVRTLWTEKEGF